MDIQQFMIDFGFEEVQTGGGCTAYRKETTVWWKGTLHQGYYLLTEDAGCMVPTEDTVSIALGSYLYDEEHSEGYSCVRYMVHDDIKHFALANASSDLLEQYNLI